MPITVGGTSITFNDSTVQSTAFTGGGGANVQTFSSSGTYTKPSGAKFVMVELWGAGGGGSGMKGTGSSGAAGSGGGGGGYATKLFAAPQVGATEPVTIGAGGSPGPGTSPTNAGTNGGTTNFGTLIYAYGGVAGSYGSPGQGGNVSYMTNLPGATGFNPSGATYPWSIIGGSTFGGSLGIWAGGRGGSSGTYGYISVFGGGGGGGGQARGGPGCCGYSLPAPSPSSNATGGMGRLMGKGTNQGPYCSGGGGGGPIGAAGNDFNGGGGGPLGATGGAGGIAGGGGGGGGHPVFGGNSAGGAGGNGYAIVYTW